jgi:pteridine reductase
VGAAICRRLHASGAKLMLHYRASAGEARLLQAELNGVRADSVALIQADLLDLAKLSSLVDQTVMRFGRLDALVNNASSFFSTPMGEIQPAQWDDLMGTNVRAPLFLAQAAAAPLKKSQGAIVNISDIHAERPLRNYVVYSVAKAALTGLTRSLARELAPDVRVNAIAPGPILWPDGDDQFDEVSRQRIISHTPLKREGTPDDIARAVHFLIADAPYVTGETINVDGGRHVAL